MSARMTVNEIALMREIVQWRKNNDVTQWKASRNLGRFTQWTGPGRNGKQVSVDFYRGDEGMRAAMSISHRQTSDDMEVGDTYSMTQAVDVLVAVGYLPARFSSAYRAGWNAVQSLIGVGNDVIDELEYAMQPLARKR